MNRISTLAIFSFSFFCIACVACLKEKAIPANVASGECADIVSYSQDIRPIIEASCKTGLGPGTGCHDAWIDEYSSIQDKILSGTWQNEVFNLKTMPQIPNSFDIDSLSEEALQIMRCWIDQGYPEN